MDVYSPVERRRVRNFDKSHSAVNALVLSAAALFTPPSALADAPFANAAKDDTKHAYFGDLHVHTGYSFDAFLSNVTTTPDDAYRFAKGEPIAHPSGSIIRLNSGPLDFLAVTDHAEYLGAVYSAAHSAPGVDGPTNLQKVLSQLSFVDLTNAESRDWIWNVHRESMLGILATEADATYQDPVAEASAWRSVIESAEEHNQPGRFTTFVGFEWTAESIPGSRQQAVMHRNIIFKGGRVPARPFTTFDSNAPEALWQWQENLRDEGIESIAVPHNSNLSKGFAFRNVDSSGRPIDQQYAVRRTRNEPLVEVAQLKGTSETHPQLSPDDEWASFGLYGSGFEGKTSPKVKGSFVRDAYRTGLEIYVRGGFNPYSFGLIGSSDGHNSAGPYEEDNYFGKIGLFDDTPELRILGPDETAYTRNRTSAALAGVWAEENTREAIFEALRRKETFGTTGPRIRARVYAGNSLGRFAEGFFNAPGESIPRAVPMGGTLIGKAPRDIEFLVIALHDARSGKLERMQMVKGWVENDASFERVYDLACAGGVLPDGAHRCPESKPVLNLETCENPEEVGAAKLQAHWKDPEFNPAEAAFYYLRVLQVPTCRWTTWEANRLGVERPVEKPAVIQERLWTSPIFYYPSQNTERSE